MELKRGPIIRYHYIRISSSLVAGFGIAYTEPELFGMLKGNTVLRFNDSVKRTVMRNLCFLRQACMFRQ